MKLIKSSFEILEQESGVEGIYKIIEKAGRVCWKSENKIEEGSAKKFVDMIANKNHFSVYEHGTVYLTIPKEKAYTGISDFSWVEERYGHNKYSKCLYFNDNFYISSNYRVLHENDWLSDLKYLCEPTEYHEKRISVRFICDRGVSHKRFVA